MRFLMWSSFRSRFSRRDACKVRLQCRYILRHLFFFDYLQIANNSCFLVQRVRYTASTEDKETRKNARTCRTGRKRGEAKYEAEEQDNKHEIMQQRPKGLAESVDNQWAKRLQQPRTYIEGY